MSFGLVISALCDNEQDAIQVTTFSLPLNSWHFQIIKSCNSFFPAWSRIFLSQFSIVWNNLAYWGNASCFKIYCPNPTTNICLWINEKYSVKRMGHLLDSSLPGLPGNHSLDSRSIGFKCHYFKTQKILIHLWHQKLNATLFCLLSPKNIPDKF